MHFGEMIVKKFPFGAYWKLTVYTIKTCPDPKCHRPTDGTVKDKQEHQRQANMTHLRIQATELNLSPANAYN